MTQNLLEGGKLHFINLLCVCLHRPRESQRSKTAYHLSDKMVETVHRFRTLVISLTIIQIPSPEPLGHDSLTIIIGYLPRQDDAFVFAN